MTVSVDCSTQRDNIWRRTVSAPTVPDNRLNAQSILIVVALKWASAAIESGPSFHAHQTWTPPGPVTQVGADATRNADSGLPSEHIFAFFLSSSFFVVVVVVIDFDYSASFYSKCMRGI